MSELMLQFQMSGQCIFKEGIEPEYEDPQNMNGGHIRIVFSGSMNYAY